MKKTSLLAIHIFSLHFLMHGQCVSDVPSSPCCNEVIETDPTSAANSERPNYLNRFDWKSTTWPVYHPAGGYNVGVNAMLLPNPFFNTTDAYNRHINYYDIFGQNRNISKLNFHPEDGWELLHQNMGFEPDRQQFATILNTRPWPYLMLYNKYTGIMRLVGSVDNVGNPSSIIRLDVG